MVAKRVDGFFYGLFMDSDLLKESGVFPENPRPAYADGWSLRIGNRATLVPEAGARAYGMLLALTHAELDKLYQAPGLEQYQPEALLVQTMEADGNAVPALCYNLLQAPHPDEANVDYAQKLKTALAKLGFPQEYIASIS